MTKYCTPANVRHTFIHTPAIVVVDQVIVAALTRISTENDYRYKVIAKAAPTGVAANAIGGETLHSLFKIPVTKDADITPLTVGMATSVCSLMKKERRNREIDLIDDYDDDGLIRVYFWVHRVLIPLQNADDSDDEPTAESRNVSSSREKKGLDSAMRPLAASMRRLKLAKLHRSWQ